MSITRSIVRNTANANCTSGVKSIPSGFNWPSELTLPTITCQGGRYDVDIRPQDLIDFSQFTNIVYVDSTRPNDLGSGASWGAAKQSIKAALTVAAGNTGGTRIFIRSGVYDSSLSISAGDLSSVLSNKSVTLEAVYGRVVTGAFDSLTWSLSASKAYTYEATVSDAITAYNPLIKDSYGDYRRYEPVASIADVESTEGSFYVDGTTAYIHPHGGVVASNDNVRIYRNIRGGVMLNTGDVYMNGIDFEGGKTGAVYAFAQLDDKYLVDENCTYKYVVAGSFDDIDRYSSVIYRRFLLRYSIDTQASSNSGDAYGVSTEDSTTPSLMCLRCSGVNNGYVTDTARSVNGFTSHQGLKGVDVGGYYDGNLGPHVVGVDDDTQILCVGTYVGASAGDVLFGGSFGYGGFLMAGGTNNLYLIECKDRANDVAIRANLPSSIDVYDHDGTGAIEGDGVVSM
jgi:hypothetical protein